MLFRCRLNTPRRLVLAPSSARVTDRLTRYFVRFVRTEALNSR